MPSYWAAQILDNGRPPTVLVLLVRITSMEVMHTFPLPAPPGLTGPCVMVFPASMDL